MAKKSHEAVHKALGAGAKAKTKLHSHSVKYSRADNGGLHAEVERHTPQGHHHTEHHVLSDPAAAAEHLQEHLGDQPQVGGAMPPQDIEPEGDEAGAGAVTGGVANPAPPMM